MELSEEDLLQKHRKERKDLQAKIQSIKKQSDKKKRKETSELITRMENELKIQQQSELDNLNSSLKNLNCNDDSEKEINDVEKLPQQSERISKAQRRRNKKTQNELETQRRIAEQELENEAGPRNLESIAIKNILDTRGLSLYSIPSNGDCLYQAINHQLEITGRNAPNVTTLRQETAKYMKLHRNDMLPFMITDDGDIMSENGYEEYCNRIETTKAWGGQVELTALSEILKCSIHVLQATGPPTIVGEQFPGVPLILTYHRYMYGLGEHYNSTITGKSDLEIAQDNF